MVGAVAGEAWAFDWSAVGALVSGAAVAVSLVLLALQRDDIAYEKGERHRQQARGVYLHASVQREAEEENVFTLTGGQVQLSNHSSEPITVEACYVTHDPDKSDEYWSPWQLGWTAVDSDSDRQTPLLLLPGQKVDWPQPTGYYAESFVGGDGESVVVQFRDARGTSWWRTSDDGEIRERYPRRRWMRRTNRFIARNTVLLGIFLWWLAMRAVRERPNGRLPLSWRFYLLLSGGAGPEGDFVDEILDRQPQTWPHSPRLLPTTLFILPPRQLADLDEKVRGRWRENFDRHVPSTWPLGNTPGAAVLGAMFRDWWRYNTNLLPAVLTLVASVVVIFLGFRTIIPVTFIGIGGMAFLLASYVFFRRASMRWKNWRKYRY